MASGTRFSFIGTAHPERLNWWFDRCEVVEPGGVLFEAEMRGSRFLAHLTLPEDEYDDLLTARNHAAAHVRTVIDAIGLLNGSAVSCEISEAIDASGKMHALDPTITELRMEHRPDELRRLIAAGFNDHAVRLGMADVRMAILNASDTGFLCYRAIEGVKTLHGSWDKFRELFEVPYDEIMELKELADPRRHGGLVSLTHEQRIVALRLAHRVLLEHASHVWAGLPAQARGDVPDP